MTGLEGPEAAPPAVILVLDDSLRHLDDEVSIDVGLMMCSEVYLGASSLLVVVLVVVEGKEGRERGSSITKV